MSGVKKKSSARNSMKEIQYRPHAALRCIPIESRKERFPELVLVPKGKMTHKQDKNYAKELAFFKHPHRYSMFAEFCRIHTWGEVLKCAQYTQGYTNDPLEIVLHNPGGKDKWYLYKKYSRHHEIVFVDRFRARLHLICLIQNMISGKTFREINDFLAIASILLEERDHRLGIQFQYGRGKRIGMRTARGEYTTDSYRAQWTRDMRKGPQLWQHIVYSKADEMRFYIVMRVSELQGFVDTFSANKLDKLESAVKEFVEENPYWSRERIDNTFNEFIIDFPYRRKDICQFLQSPSTWFCSLTPNQLYQQFVEWPTFTGHVLFMCRALKPINIQVYGNGVYSVVDSDNPKGRPLRILPSRYSHMVPMTAVITKTESDPVLSFEQPPDYPPTVSTMSGISSISTLSVATTTPGSWHHQWKIQTMHKDYEHRAGEVTLQNPLAEHNEGKMEFTVRFDTEVDKRLEGIQNLKKNFEEIFHSSNPLGEYFALLINGEKMFHQTVRPSDYFAPWKTPIEGRLMELVNREMNKEEEIECSILLRSYMEMSRIDGCFTEYQSDESEGENMFRRGHINNAWRKLLESGNFDEESLRLLLIVISSEHVFLPDGDLCSSTICNRSDKICMTQSHHIITDIYWKRRATTFYSIAFFLLFVGFVVVLSPS